MSKNITITNVDGVDLADKHNMGSNQTQPRKKVKMLHEQLYEQYGIDPVKIYERTGMLKTIPHDWIPEILILNINNCKTPKTRLNVNQNERAIVVEFETAELCKKFYGDPDGVPPVQSEFNLNINKSINDYITSKKEDPKRYNRILVTESSSDGQQVVIRF